MESRNRPWHEPSLGARRAGGPSPGWAEAPQTRRSHRTWHSAAAGSYRATTRLSPGSGQRRVQEPGGRGRSREQEGAKEVSEMHPRSRREGAGRRRGGLGRETKPGSRGWGPAPAPPGATRWQAFLTVSSPPGDAKPCDQPAAAQTSSPQPSPHAALTCAPQSRNEKWKWEAAISAPYTGKPAALRAHINLHCNPLPFTRVKYQAKDRI